MAFPKMFRNRADGHVIYARVTTGADVAAGRAGAKGDFLALRDGHNAQWHPKAAFLEQYEEIDNAGADELTTGPDEAEAILAGEAERQAPPPAPESSSAAAADPGNGLEARVDDLERRVTNLENFNPAGATTAAAGDDAPTIAQQLEELRRRVESIDDAGAQLLARVDMLETAAADPRTRATDETPAPADDADSSSSSSSRRGRGK